MVVILQTIFFTILTINVTLALLMLLMDRISLDKEYYKQPFVVNSFIKNVLFGLVYMIMVFLADAWEMRSLALEIPENKPILRTLYKILEMVNKTRSRI